MDIKQLTQNLGGRWAGSYGTAPCPVCQPEGRADQNALTLGGDADRVLLHCKKAGCDFRDILAAAGVGGQVFQPDPEAPRDLEHQRRMQAAEKMKRARAIWERGLPMAGTPGDTYLRGRGITCVLPDSLRWLPDAYHSPSGKFCSAMVADVSSGGVHRTFFDKQGQRLPKSAKMMFGPCGGGAVRLSEAIGPLVVCEGIETGLSLLSVILDGPATVKAALSSSGMKALELPHEPHKLIVATDGDDAGREAGNSLAMRATALGWQVDLLPAPDGQDWNDVLKGMGVPA